MWDADAEMWDAKAESWDAEANISYENIQAAKARAESTDELTIELKDDKKRAADCRKEAADSRAEALNCRAKQKKMNFPSNSSDIS
jgi:hypothetical protein